MQRARAADAFEAVVLGRIVAAGDHDGAVRVQVLRRVIEHRRGDGADVGDVATGGQQALDERVAQARGTEPAIASDVDVGAAAVTAQIGAEAASKLFDVRAEKFGIRDAPDVVLAKNGRLEHISNFRGWGLGIGGGRGSRSGFPRSRSAGASRRSDVMPMRGVTCDFDTAFRRADDALAAVLRSNQRH